MSSLTEFRIDHERNLDGTEVWQLPRRGSGKLGLILLIIGLAIAGFGVFWMSGPVAAALSSKGQGGLQVFLWLFALSGVLPVGVGLFIAMLGLVALFGRGEVLLDRESVRGADRLGPFRWKRRPRRIDRIAKLDVTVGTQSTNGGPSKPMPNFALLLALTDVEAKAIKSAFKNKQPGGLKDAFSAILAWGYPRETLLALANELAEQMESAGGAKLFDRDEIKVTESLASDYDDDQDNDRSAVAEILPQPESSTATLESSPPGVTIKLPRQGMSKASKGSLGFGIVWTALTLGFAALMFTSAGTANFQGSIWIGVGILLLFLLFGVSTILGVWNAGGRRGTIDVMAGTLLVTYRSPLRGEKQFEWSVGDIESVRRGPSGTEINDRPVLCLLVETKAGKSHKFFSERDDDELRWIASVVKQELGVRS